MNWTLRNSQRGLTLVELMAAVAILAVLLSLGAPSLGDALARYRIRVGAHDLVSAMSLARAEAMGRGVSVTVCPLAEPPAEECGDNYARGWQVFSNPGRDASLDGGIDEPIRFFSPLPRGYSITNRQGSRIVADRITWYPDGSARKNLTLLVCAPGSARTEPYAVVLNLVGRARVSQGEGSCPGASA